MNAFDLADYDKEIKELAADIALGVYIAGGDDSDIREQASEAIDQHEWINDYILSASVVNLSDSKDAYLNAFGYETLGEMVAMEGVEAVTTLRAFYAMTYDVIDLAQIRFDYHQQNGAN